MQGGAADPNEAVLVALGANLSLHGRSCVEVLDAALGELATRGIGVVRRSRPWRSQAWPNADDPPFVNAVAQVVTTLSPAALLAELHAVEATFGRRREMANAPRTLDLDLIAYGRCVQAGPPELPHPRATERRFVMGPLAEIAPGWRDPRDGRAAQDLADAAQVGADAYPEDA